MRSRDATILIIPGLGNSGVDHWQSRWQGRLASAQRVEQADWDRPVKDDWAHTIAEAVRQADRPVVAVTHSLGCIAFAHAIELLSASGHRAKVAGAFLVAPTSQERIQLLEAIDPAFAPIPRSPLPFKSVVIASRNDPNPYDASEETARHWGATLIDAGESGRINAESGHGPWPEGLMSFASFMNGL